MFTIPVDDLINSYDGDSKIFSFDGEIFDGFYEDLTFLKPLLFTIKLIVIEDGIHGIFTNFSTEVSYENKKTRISIPEFERIWKTQVDPLDGDDINLINTKNMTIDLKDVIREEIIMAFHAENL
ncbi:hypothetical protein HG442_000350 [Candidatus Gracilibacteria bacterium]|nr:hypothetical protein [Candidatus Gracilibacteria bacterium]